VLTEAAGADAYPAKDSAGAGVYQAKASQTGAGRAALERSPHVTDVETSPLAAACAGEPSPAPAGLRADAGVKKTAPHSLAGDERES